MLQKDFILQERTPSKRVETELREEYAAETGVRQDVSHLL
jgi:hypothetical protein